MTVKRWNIYKYISLLLKAGNYKSNGFLNRTKMNNFSQEYKKWKNFCMSSNGLSHIFLLWM